ncbi:Uncharacterized protein Rs2_48109 [Raphanus sativus]|nr:Uncharacterized protein Rs2_48109 [Raphanus sativus]
MEQQTISITKAGIQATLEAVVKSHLETLVKLSRVLLAVKLLKTSVIKDEVENPGNGDEDQQNGAAESAPATADNGAAAPLKNHTGLKSFALDNTKKLVKTHKGKNSQGNYEAFWSLDDFKCIRFLDRYVLHKLFIPLIDAKFMSRAKAPVLVCNQILSHQTHLTTPTSPTQKMLLGYLDKPECSYDQQNQDRYPQEDLSKSAFVRNTTIKSSNKNQTLQIIVTTRDKPEWRNAY